MKTWIIIVLAIAAGAALIWWGIKSKSLPKALGGVIAVIGGILGGFVKKNSDMKAELKKKDAEIAERKKTTEVVKNVQKEIKEIDRSTEGKPEKVNPPASGDSSDRLDRLNRL